VSMVEPRTLKTLGILVVAYIVLALPAYIGPAFLAEPSAYFMIVPFLSVHLFQRLGIPGLLQNDGLCGWGLCGPTAFGWLFAAAFWIGMAWIAAWAIARLTLKAHR
jgi:hypothetical protein